MDIRVADQGTIVLFTPLTKAAQFWLNDHLARGDHLYWYDSLVVEHRFASDLLDGMICDGLEVS